MAEKIKYWKKFTTKNIWTKETFLLRENDIMLNSKYGVI